jgi:molybdate transport system substrate-binding protein
MRKTGFGLAVFATLLGGTAARAQATVEVFSAGSLRGVVDGLSREAGPAFNITVKPSFGGSGSMRERIEKGETPDLLLSADLGSPQKLQTLGRTTVPVVPFARNRMCVISRRAAGVTPANLIDRMLAKGVRVKTGTPIADPAGDYGWAILDKIDALRPGAGKTLKDKANAVMTVTAPPASPGQNAQAALFSANLIDIALTYCSGEVEKGEPALASFEIPARLDPHPVYGMAVLSTKPEAMRLALYLLSEKGQAIIAKAGLVPLVDPAH